MAYTQILYHIVLRTKRSEQSIAQENVSSLYKYIWGIIKTKKEIYTESTEWKTISIIRKRIRRMS